VLIPESKQLIASTADGLLLGVVDDAGRIQVFKCGFRVVMNGVEILGHEDLAQSGAIHGQGLEGFSILVKNGRITALFLHSKLISASNRYNIADEKIAAIIRELDAGGASVYKQL